MAKRRLGPRLLLTCAFLLVVVLASSPWSAPALGWALVRDESPAKADVAVCLAGDWYGDRILKTSELVKNGFVPQVLVSSPAGAYGVREADLAIRFAVKHTFPAEWFIPSPNEALSTREEAVSLLADLRRRKVKSFLLVTSNYHTARAARVFRRALSEGGDPITFRTVAAPHKFFQPSHWWSSRESRKIFFNEWVKTVTGPLGI